MTIVAAAAVDSLTQNRVLIADGDHQIQPSSPFQAQQLPVAAAHFYQRHASRCSASHQGLPLQSAACYNVAMLSRARHRMLVMHHKASLPGLPPSHLHNAFCEVLRHCQDACSISTQYAHLQNPARKCSKGVHSIINIIEQRMLKPIGINTRLQYQTKLQMMKHHAPRFIEGGWALSDT